jgi:multidrug efflux system membrane fusion protein
MFVSRKSLARFVSLILCAAGAGIASQWLIVGQLHGVVPAQPQEQAVPVKAVAVTRRDVPIELDGLGTVQAFNTVTIKPRVGGQIVNLPFSEGQELAPGAVVAHIDPRLFEAALHQVQGTKAKDEAQLANAELDLGRASTLAQRGYATAQSLDTQKATVQALRAAIEADAAAVDSAQTQLDYATVSSPIGGVAGLRMVDAGNVIAPSDPGIVVVTQLQPIAVVFSLPEESIRNLAVGQPKALLPVLALARDNETTLARGTLSLVDNRIDPTTGMARLKAVFPNTDRALKPGQFVNARLEMERFRGVLTLPSAAIQRDSQGTYVFVIRLDATADQRRVQIERNAGNLAIVANGVREGEQVVLDGQYDLKPGVKVEVQSSTSDGRIAAALPGLP